MPKENNSKKRAPNLGKKNYRNINTGIKVRKRGNVIYYSAFDKKSDKRSDKRNDKRKSDSKTAPNRKIHKHNKKESNKIKSTIVTFIFSFIISALDYSEKIYTKLKERFAGWRKYMYYIWGAIAIVVLTAGIGTVIWATTNKNAQDVFLNGTLIGTIRDKTITAEKLYEEALLKLKTEQGVPVIVNEEVTTEPVHASKTDELSYVIGEIYKNFTFSVQAACIIVDGVEMAIVRTKQDANSILNALKDDYNQEGLNITSLGFVEEVEITERYVEQDEIISNERATEILTENKAGEVTHTVVKDDSLWKISIDTGMTVDEILNMNPELNGDPSKLRIGSVLKLTRSQPFLSVRTTERRTHEEVIEMPVETQYNNSQPRSYSKVIQQGREGRMEVISEIIRINGHEIERNVIYNNEIEEAITQITEVGTN